MQTVLTKWWLSTEFPRNYEVLYDISNKVYSILSKLLQKYKFVSAMIILLDIMVTEMRRSFIPAWFPAEPPFLTLRNLQWDSLMG